MSCSATIIPASPSLGRLKPGVTAETAPAPISTNIAHELTEKISRRRTPGGAINALTLLDAGVGDYRAESRSASRRRRLRPAHRLRQRRQPATGARSFPRQGTGGAHRDGREPLAPDAAACSWKAPSSAWSAARSGCSSRSGASTQSTRSARRVRFVSRRRGSIR